jgi:hypothetical protein
MHIVHGILALFVTLYCFCIQDTEYANENLQQQLWCVYFSEYNYGFLTEVLVALFLSKNVTFKIL